MLQHTFCHLSGISAKREQLLWSEGIHSWGDLLALRPSPFSPSRTTAILAELQHSADHLGAGEPLFFSRQLPARERWRLFSSFRSHTAYLDIETTGLGSHDHITTIALYDGQVIRHYVHGRNLEEFIEDIGRYRLLVTYNGSCFDIPFIERQLHITLPHAHIDLMYLLRSLGFKGGLKGCERQLGISRDGLDGVDGFLAVLLWRDYLKHGNQAALETLLAYNIADAVNLEQLLIMACNLKLNATPFTGNLALPQPLPPASPFEADSATVRRLKMSHYYP